MVASFSFGGQATLSKALYSMESFITPYADVEPKMLDNYLLSTESATEPGVMLT